MSILKTESILIIDDDKEIRQCLSDVFKTLRLSCLMAEDCQQGLKILKSRKHTISFVLLDLTMPGMGTLEFIFHLRKIQRYGRLPVMAMSATAEKSPIAGFPGVHGFIAKPFDFKILLKTVKKMSKKMPTALL